MTPEDVSTGSALTAAIGAAAAGAVLGLRKLWLVWKTDGATGAEVDARKEVIHQLHGELTRMSAQNLLLANEVNKLQLSVMQMNRQLHELTAENCALRSQVERLGQEISRLYADRAAHP